MAGCRRNSPVSQDLEQGQWGLGPRGPVVLVDLPRPCPKSPFLYLRLPLAKQRQIGGFLAPGSGGSEGDWAWATRGWGSWGW